MNQLRLNLDGSLVVPPFECAWLTGSGHELVKGSGCIIVEARTETDVTIILKPCGPVPASKRHQPLQRASERTQLQDASGTSVLQTPSSTSGAVEANYTVIFGSHRNQCLKIEKNGAMVCQVQGVAGSKVSPKEYGCFWVDVNKGVISVGMGDPCAATMSHQWVDPEPIHELKYVGLSCWDRHVSYRNIKVLPTFGFPVQAVADAAFSSTTWASSAVPSLFDICTQQMIGFMATNEGPDPCEVSQIAEFLLPNTRVLHRACLDHIARQFADIAGVPAQAQVLRPLPSQPTQTQASNNSDTTSCTLEQSSAQQSDCRSIPGSSIKEAHTQGFEFITPTFLCDLLAQDTIALPEKTIFDVVVRWAHAFINNSHSLHKSYGAERGSTPEVSPTQDQLCVSLESSSLDEPCLDHEVGEEVARVLGLIRYPLMTNEELQGVLGEALVMDHSWVQGLVVEALGYAATPSCKPEHGLGGTQSKSMRHGPFAVEGKRLVHRTSMDGYLANAARFTRRALPLCVECAYVCDGDGNGALRYIGTMYGAQEWVNPVLARRVTVRASSPASRHTDPKALCGDKFLQTNFCGPRYVNGAPDTWWLVDLGPAHSLIPTYYTMRHDGSTDYPRSWVLQGSVDGSSWSDLSSHSRDGTIKKPGQYASWPVFGPAAQVPYTLFRLLLTGPTTSKAQPYAFPLSYLELYGYLRCPAPAAAPGAPTGPATCESPTSKSVSAVLNL